MGPKVKTDPLIKKLEEKEEKIRLDKSNRVKLTHKINDKAVEIEELKKTTPATVAATTTRNNSVKEKEKELKEL
jgi:hypothetical protein